MALVLLFAATARAQDSQFYFDPNGNLLVQTAAATAPPQILGQPQNRIVVPGESASFSVVAADTRALTYEWRFNGIPLGGSATNDTLLLPNVNVSKAGEYRVVLTNPSGSVTSAPAFLMIDSDADGLSDAWEMTHFGNLSQYASGDADGDGASNLQEFQDGSDPTDSNSVYFRLLVLRDGGSVIKTFDRITYTNGELVTLTGVGLPGQEPFHAWMGDILTRSNPVTLVMTNNKTVIARFTPIVFTWTNLTSGDWDIATNWTPHLAPGSNDVVIIPNGTVTLNGPAKCADVTLDAGSLTGTGTLTVLRNFLWNSGTMSGSGRTLVETSATLEIASPFASLDTRTLENAGTIKFSGLGSLGVRGGAVITNRPGALVHVQNAASVGGVFPNGQLDNAGTFRKSNGGGTATFDTGVKFNNTGVVEIETGTLSLAGGGANNGTFTTPATAVLEWAGGTFTLNPGAQLNGPGIYRIAGSATVVSNGDLTVPNLDLAGVGTWSGTGTLAIADTMNWTAGSMSGSGRTLVSPAAILQLGGASGVTVNRILENGGNTFWSGAGGIIMGNGVITNRPGALFQAQNSASFFFAGGSCRFDNAGTFRKTSSSGLTTVPSGVPFNNLGTVEIQTGTLLCNGLFTNNGVVHLSAGTTNRFAAGGSASGVFTTPGTALVEWTGGTFTLNTGAQLNGAGLYRIEGSATVVGDGDLTVPNLDLVSGSGTWSGAGTLTIANAINWTAGGMRGSGRTVVPPGVTLQLGSASSVTVNRTLENGGNTFWMGTGGIIMLTGVITNRPGALFQAQNSAPFFFAGGSCRFDNAGTFRKTSSTGLTTVPSGVPFNNFGTLEIRSGIFAANGGYVSTSDARFNCALGGTTPGTDYGQLQIAGAVTLNGALSVSLTNGFIPAIHDTFTVLTAGTRSGAFSDFQYPSNVVTMTLSNAPNSVQVQVTGILPPHVVGDARFFYNRSALDGNDPAANAADDGAIAIDKVPLRPGQKASFAHYTSYSRGLNGVMIDVAGFPGTPAAGDFTFKQGNDNNPGAWSPAPAPSEIAFRSNGGGGGADRLTLVWPDNAMENQWLEVTLRATATTGLSANEVFYFGNAIGETGNSISDCNVLVNDALRILNNLSTVGVEVANPFDINRTASVLVNDALITLNHLVAGSQALQLIDLTGGAAPASVNHSAILYVNRAGLIEAILRGEQNQLRPSGVRAESRALNASNERRVNLLAVERTVEGAWQFLFDGPRGAAPRVWQTDDLGQAQWQVVPDHQLREQWESLITVEVPPDDLRETTFFRFELDDRP